MGCAHSMFGWLTGDAVKLAKFSKEIDASQVYTMEAQATVKQFVQMYTQKIEEVLTKMKVLEDVLTGEGKKLLEVKKRNNNNKSKSTEVLKVETTCRRLLYEKEVLLQQYKTLDNGLNRLQKKNTIIVQTELEQLDVQADCVVLAQLERNDLDQGKIQKMKKKIEELDEKRLGNAEDKQLEIEVDQLESEDMASITSSRNKLDEFLEQLSSSSSDAYTGYNLSQAHAKETIGITSLQNVLRTTHLEKPSSSLNTVTEASLDYGALDDISMSVNIDPMVA